MAMSSYLRDKVLDHYLKGTAFSQPANIYVSLHTADPGLTGASEVTGGSYARQLANASFAAASSGSKSTNAIIDFAGMPAATVSYAGIWDTSSSGNFLVGGSLTSPKTVGAGDTFRFASGSLVITQT
jgi:hypothetical protein